MPDYQRFSCFVGVPGFEPGTSCSQSRRANRTALHPVALRLSGAKVVQVERSAKQKTDFFCLRFLNAAHPTLNANSMPFIDMTSPKANSSLKCENSHNLR